MQQNDYETSEAIDRAVQNRRRAGDKTMDALLTTVPRADAARRDALEDRLIAQLQQQQTGDNPMTIQALPRSVRAGRTLRPLSLTLSAAMMALFLAVGIAVIANRPPGNGTTLSALDQAEESATPAPSATSPLGSVGTVPPPASTGVNAVQGNSKCGGWNSSFINLKNNQRIDAPVDISVTITSTRPGQPVRIELVSTEDEQNTYTLVETRTPGDPINAHPQALNDTLTQLELEDVYELNPANYPSGTYNLFLIMGDNFSPQRCHITVTLESSGTPAPSLEGAASVFPTATPLPFGDAATVPPPASTEVNAVPGSMMAPTTAGAVAVEVMPNVPPTDGCSGGRSITYPVNGQIIRESFDVIGSVAFQSEGYEIKLRRLNGIYESAISGTGESAANNSTLGTIDISDYPSGEYRLALTLTGEYGTVSPCLITIYLMPDETNPAAAMTATPPLFGEAGASLTGKMLPTLPSLATVPPSEVNATFTPTPTPTWVTSRQLLPDNLVPVIIAAVDLPANHELGSMSSVQSLRVVYYPADLVPQGAYQDINAVSGRYSLRPITAYQPILEQDTADAPLPESALEKTTVTVRFSQFANHPYRPDTFTSPEMLRRDHVVELFVFSPLTDEGERPVLSEGALIIGYDDTGETDEDKFVTFEVTIDEARVIHRVIQERIPIHSVRVRE